MIPQKGHCFDAAAVLPESVPIVVCPRAVAFSDLLLIHPGHGDARFVFFVAPFVLDMLEFRHVDPQAVELTCWGRLKKYAHASSAAAVAVSTAAETVAVAPRRCHVFVTCYVYVMWCTWHCYVLMSFYTFIKHIAFAFLYMYIHMSMFTLDFCVL